MKLLLLFLCLALLFSCSAQSPTNTEKLTQEEKTVEIKGLAVVMDGVCPYKVIRPEEASDEIIAAAKVLIPFCFISLILTSISKTILQRKANWKYWWGIPTVPRQKSFLILLKRGSTASNRSAKK